MELFVKKGSIVREIWGKSDTILFIFAGSAAEFALNKAVDWLYFTGSLPANPIGRLFSTVSYARQIVFSELDEAHAVIKKITAIHSAVEAKRGDLIPEWAYRDVLFMLIDYSIRSYELLERKLSEKEKEEVFDVFSRLGQHMGLKQLPENFMQWLNYRAEHMENDLEKSRYTEDLYRQYLKQLGKIRYWILIEAQTLITPGKVKQLLGLRKLSFLFPLISLYKFLRLLKLDTALKFLLLPKRYLAEIKAMDQSGQ